MWQVLLVIFFTVRGPLLGGQPVGLFPASCFSRPHRQTAPDPAPYLSWERIFRVGDLCRPSTQPLQPHDPCGPPVSSRQHSSPPLSTLRQGGMWLLVAREAFCDFSITPPRSSQVMVLALGTVSKAQGADRACRGGKTLGGNRADWWGLEGRGQATDWLEGR